MLKKPFLSCFSAALLFFYIIFQMTVFNSVNGQLQDGLGLSVVALGSISSFYFYCAAISIIPFGLMLDRFPTRKPTLIIVLLCVIATFLFALFPSIATVSVYRAICGLTNSLVFLICMRQAPMWFPGKISLAISLIITVGMLGGMMQYPFSLIMVYLGWKIALFVDAFFGLGLFLVALIFLQDKPGSLHIDSSGILHQLKLAMSIKENWLCGVFTGCLNLPVLVLAATWGDQYLMSIGISQANAAFLVSMIFLGMIPASPFFGWFVDFWRSRKKAMFMGNVASIIAVLAVIFYHGNSIIVFALLFFALGFTCTSQIISYTVVNEINPVVVSSTAISLVSILVYLFAAVVNPLFGRVSTEFSIKMAVMILPFAFIFSLITIFFVRETYKCQSVVKLS